MNENTRVALAKYALETARASLGRALQELHFLRATDDPKYTDARENVANADYAIEKALFGMSR